MALIKFLLLVLQAKLQLVFAQGLKESSNTPSVVGITSHKNLAFVEKLNCYDQIVTYDDLSSVRNDLSTVMVDMAGSREVLGTLHGSLGDNMLKCLTVGMTHWDNEVTAEDALGQQC